MSVLRKMHLSNCIERLGNTEERDVLCGRVPLPGQSLADHTYDGFGAKAFVAVPEELEDERLKEFFPDEDLDGE